MNAHPCGTHIVMVYIMTIRIDVNSEGPEVVVYLAGRLSGDAAEQLRDTFILPILPYFLSDCTTMRSGRFPSMSPSFNW